MDIQLKLREQILYNELELPSMDKFVSQIGDHYASLANSMFKAAWYQYLRNKKPINLTYWSDKFNNPKVFNIVLMSLAKGGWLETHSIPARNWAEAVVNEKKLLEFVSPDELEVVRATHKFAKYILRHKASTVSRLTKLNGKTINTGLKREGFMKAGNTPFKYDTAYMEKYKEAIQLNLTKSMDKIAEQCPNLRHDRASYDTISIHIMKHHMDHSDKTFTRGNNFNDSRGRAISSSLAKVANPISCKDFRSLLIIPDDKE